jgi:phage tail protein X
MPKTYLTRSGDAWDLIAKEQLGHETMAHHLMAANPDLRDVVIFQADVKLILPDVEAPAQEKEPPWQSR